MTTTSLNKVKAGDAWPVALRLLSRRNYSEAELRRGLAAKGFPAAAVDQAISRASELGYLDDQRYTTQLARVMLESGRAVGARLAGELRRRGLADELIETAVSATREDGREDQALQMLIARRFPAFDFAVADERERRRVVTFLQRRGFPLDRILTQLKRTDP